MYRTFGGVSAKANDPQNKDVMNSHTLQPAVFAKSMNDLRWSTDNDRNKLKNLAVDSLNGNQNTTEIDGMSHIDTTISPENNNNTDAWDAISDVDVQKLLQPQNENLIVDIKISETVEDDRFHSSLGYEQLKPPHAAPTTSKDIFEQGSFLMKQSIWIWRKKQGTFSGRLRPITNLKLIDQSESTELVRDGYSCINKRINGQWLWIKRAFHEEEELDGICDFCISINETNSYKKLSDSPGVGWFRVDGNFSKTILFNKKESSLWFRPLRVGSIHANTTSASISTSSNAHTEFAKLFTVVRNILRHTVSISEVEAFIKHNIANNGDAANSTVLFSSSSPIDRVHPSISTLYYSVSYLSITSIVYDY